MSHTVSESIWSNERYTIPMAEVSHFEKHGGNIIVIFKHSRWVNDANGWEPNVYLTGKDAESFRKDWCMYRHELELETLVETA